MINVKVNDQNISIPTSANDDVILMYYLSYKTKKIYAFPYLRLFYIKEKEYGVESIQSYMKKLGIFNLVDHYKMLISLFPKLTMRQIFFVYYRSQPSDRHKEIVSLTKNTPFKHVIQGKSFDDDYKSYMEEYKQEENNTRNLIKRTVNIYTQLSQIKTQRKHSSPEFDLEEASLKAIIPLVSQIPLEDFFDKITVLQTMPFVALKKDGKITSHVYPSFSFPTEWIELLDTVPDNVIFFMVRHDQKKKGDNTINPKSYSPGTCDIDGNIDIKVDLKNGGNMKNAMLFTNKSIQNSGAEIANTDQGYIKGTFKISCNQKYNKLVFCDMLDCDNLVKDFCFTADTIPVSDDMFKKGNEISRTTLEKKRLLFYYSLYHGYNKKNAMTIIMTLMTGTNNQFSIRVSKAKNLNDVNAFILTFSKILDIYDNKYDEIKTLYKNLSIDQSFIDSFEKVKVIKLKENLKSKHQLRSLQDLDDMFRTGGTYATKCESKRQPYPVENLDKTKKEFIDLYPDIDPDTLILDFPIKGKTHKLACVKTSTLLKNNIISAIKAFADDLHGKYSTNKSLNSYINVLSSADGNATKQDKIIHGISTFFDKYSDRVKGPFDQDAKIKYENDDDISIEIQYFINKSNQTYKKTILTHLQIIYNLLTSNNDYKYPGIVKAGLPCCFKNPRKKEMTEERNIAKHHIVNYGKQLLEDQRGELPFDIQRIMNTSTNKYKSSKINGKLTDFPFLRLGMPDSGFTILQCLEYVGRNGVVTEEDINHARNSLANSNFDILKTLTSFNKTSAKANILNTNAEIHVSEYRRLLEQYYGFNIIVIYTDDNENKYGQILVEKSNVYISPSIFEYDEFVVVCQTQKDDKVRCELVIKAEGNNISALKFDKKEPFISELLKVYEIMVKTNVVNNEHD